MESFLKSRKTVSVPASAAAAPVSSSDSALISSQRWIIVIMSVILVISLLGASNTYMIFGNALTNLIKTITDFVIYIAANLGYSTGTILNTTTNVASNAAITSIEVADGAVNSVGNIFRDANSNLVFPEIKNQMDKVQYESQDFLLLPRKHAAGGAPPATHVGVVPAAAPPASVDMSLRSDLDDIINRVKRIEAGEIDNDNSESVIQQRTTTDKTAWCLVGSYGGKRSCISLQPGDKCGYARLYDDKVSCMQHTA